MKDVLKHITRITVLSFVSLYLCAFVLLRISAVQGHLADNVAEALSEKFGTKVTVGTVDIRLFNRIVVDDLMVYDQQQKEMLRVARLSAAVELLPLMEGEISISSAQLFGMHADLYRKDSMSPLNCQFVIDSLSSKDTSSPSAYKLNIASLVIRNSSLTYDQNDKPMRRGAFSPYHLNVSKLSSHIILYKLSGDTLDASIKRLAFEEQSGISLKNLSASFIKTPCGINISDFTLNMPGTDVRIPRLMASCRFRGDSLVPGSLSYSVSLSANEIDVRDFSPLLSTYGSQAVSQKTIAALPHLSLSISSKGTDKDNNTSLSLQSIRSNAVAVQSTCRIVDRLGKTSVSVTLGKCRISESLLAAVTSQFSLPSQLSQLGNVNIQGRVRSSGKDDIDGNFSLAFSKAGKARLIAEYHRNHAKVHLETPSLTVSQIARARGFGSLKCNVDAEAHTVDGRTLAEVKSLADINGSIKGDIGEFTYNSYTYHAINLDAVLLNSTIKGSASINDPNIRLNAEGSASLGRVKNINASLSLRDFSPTTLHLTDAIGRKDIDADCQADLEGTDIDNMLGTMSIDNVVLTDNSNPSNNAYLRNMTFSSRRLDTGEKEVTLNSDFADIDIRGNIILTEIPHSVTNILSQYLPSIPGLPKVRHTTNDFTVDATFKDMSFIRQLVSIPVSFKNDITLRGYVNSSDNSTDLTLSAPDLSFNGKKLRNTQMRLWTPEGILRSTLYSLYVHNGKDVSLSLDCRGEDNQLFTSLKWDNMRENLFRGNLNAVSQFYTDFSGNNAVRLSIPHSTFEVGDTLWTIHSQNVEYSDGKVLIDHFAVENNSQHVYLDGIVSDNVSDSLVADLKGINVEYIMNLINFHSVEFSGLATGRAVGYGITGNLRVMAHLDVSDFLFEHGAMGTLHADARYSNATEQIDLDAVCDDSQANARTLISGNISPQRNTIDLDIKAEDTRLGFVQSLCGSFLRDTNLRGNGRVRLAGPLDAINMTGVLAARGDLTISATNCHYTMVGDTITFVPDDILFKGCRLKDKYDNLAYLTGGVHHQNLARMSFDLTMETTRFLAYDFPTLDGSSFCGHAIIDGSIGLHGRGNEVNIVADCSTLKGSYIVYDATSPDAIKSQDFITWGSLSDESHEEVQHEKANAGSDAVVDDDDPNNSGNDRTNVRMRLMVNATADTKLHVVMDAMTGDYIDLYGSGGLRIDYFNKGSMNIYGNYAIDHGTYKMTLQNILRRDFEFQKGGMISFGGDPYNAVLKMQCAYNLNSVSLADLNIGTSFKANNVPVKCLMDIGGTPAKPTIAFNLDLPSLSTDARQMVYSIINSEEDMNQQVLYLLAIGRFYSQQQNSEQNTQRVNQTSLAMQSFLSGTISQQFNNIINQAIGSRNWSVGANITPGADGFNNAEYEGLLSGRLFNNRLLFNGQFGYRDNVTTNSQNFIGDFSLQYLLVPNGNLAIKVYNQSNDRYFTRNSLNTQGVGLVIQKEFGK